MSTSENITETIRQWSLFFVQRSIQDFKQFMQETGLSFSQFFVLMGLYHGGTCSISDVGEEMGVSTAAASQSVHRLVQMGLIERSEDPEDRRAKRIKLTFKGRLLVEKSITERGQWINELADQLPTDQHDTVISALTILTAAALKTK